MGRSPCCSKDSVNRGAWSAAEDSLLTKYIETHGEGGWRSLPKKAGLRRCGKSCRLRWLNYLRPNIKRGNISPDEEELIIRMHGLLGNRWSLIAGRVPGRTDNEIKNYWNTYLSKKLAFEGLDPKTHKPILDSRDKDESRPAITMTSRCINPLKSRTAARSGSVLFEIPDDHDKNINRECPKQSDLKYDPKVADDRHNFLSSFSVQINDDPSPYSHPPDYNCSPKDVDNTLTAGPDDNLIDVEVISSPGLDMIVSPLPEVHNLSSADNLQSNSMSLFKSTSDFASSSDIVKTTNDLSYFNATVSDLHDQPVMPLVKIDCPLQESADQINSHTSTGVLPVLAASDHIEHDKKDKINVHADQKTNVLDVLSFFEVGDAEKEMCCNRVDPDWEQDRYPHLEADTASMCHGLMHQLKWDDHDCLQLQGDQTGSCSPDYGLTDGAMWEALLWHEE